MWERRVAGWRRSGLTSEQFCEGQDFKAGLLRHWASRLGNRRARPEIRLARVVRVTEGEASVGEGMTIEVGRGRVWVRPGFDRGMLASVVEVLAEVCGGER